MSRIAIGYAVGVALAFALAPADSRAARRGDDPAAARIDTFSAQAKRAKRSAPRRAAAPVRQAPAYGPVYGPAGGPPRGVDPDPQIRLQIERSRGHAG